MEDDNNQQLNNKINSNNVYIGIPCILNHSQEQYKDLEENKYSSKYNLSIIIFYIDLGNQSLNNDSAPFHEFEQNSFNATKLIEEYGEPNKISNSSK